MVNQPISLITNTGIFALIIVNIFLVGVTYWVKKKSNKKPPIEEQEKTWKDKNNLIEFKKFDYEQVFVFVFGLIAVIIFFFGLFFSNAEKSQTILGPLTIIILSTEVAGIMLFCISILGKARKISSFDIEYLYRKKDGSIEEFYKEYPKLKKN